MSYTFTRTGDFGFTDPNDSPANNFDAVKITTLPANGTLTNNGSAVGLGSFVSIADITAGKLKFSPALNANGAGYASFTFQVQDDGGIANGGVDLDQSAHTMTIDVTPSTTRRRCQQHGHHHEDTTTRFTPVDFGFSDPNDSPANTLAGGQDHHASRQRHADRQRCGGRPGQFVSIGRHHRGQAASSRRRQRQRCRLRELHLPGAGRRRHRQRRRRSRPERAHDDDRRDAVNDAPAGPTTRSPPRGHRLRFTAGDFGFSDPNDSPANTSLRSRSPRFPPTAR
jgi:hypothetical protein